MTEPRIRRGPCPRLELHHLTMWTHSTGWWTATHTHTYYITSRIKYGDLYHKFISNKLQYVSLFYFISYNIHNLEGGKNTITISCEKNEWHCSIMWKKISDIIIFKIQNTCRREDINLLTTHYQIRIGWIFIKYMPGYQNTVFNK